MWCRAKYFSCVDSIIPQAAMLDEREAELTKSSHEICEPLDRQLAEWHGSART
jgi:hypothetical protein